MSFLGNGFDNQDIPIWNGTEWVPGPLVPTAFSGQGTQTVPVAACSLQTPIRSGEAFGVCVFTGVVPEVDLAVGEYLALITQVASVGDPIRFAIYDDNYDLVAGSPSDIVAAPASPSFISASTVGGGQVVLQGGVLYYFAVWSGANGAFFLSTNGPTFGSGPAITFRATNVDYSVTFPANVAAFQGDRPGTSIFVQGGFGF